MAKYGLIGRGIAESGSPALFKAAYKDRHPYELIDVPSFEEGLKLFKKEYAAVNVTSPYKEEALNAATEVSDAAELCGAANMLIKLPGGKILADNSDFEGVTLSIMSALAVADTDVDLDDEDALVDYLADKTALIVGCSGAGKAAAAATVTMGYGKTVLMNRTIAKAQALKEHLAAFYEDLSEDELCVESIENFEQCMQEADLVVYTLPVSILPEGFSIKKSGAQPKFVLEANYKTPCLEQFKDCCNYISGLNWLYNQAVVAYEAFTGIQPDEEAMKQVL